MSKYNDLMNKVEVSADMKSRILLNIAKELEAEEIQETEEALEVEAVQEAEEIRETEGAQEVEGTQEAEGTRKVEKAQDIRVEQDAGDDAVEGIDAKDDKEVEEEAVRDIGKTASASEINVVEIPEMEKEEILRNTEVRENAESISNFEERARAKRKASIRRFVAMAATFAVLFVGASAVMRMGSSSEMASTAPASDSAMMEAATEAPMEMEAMAEAPTEVEDAGYANEAVEKTDASSLMNAKNAVESEVTDEAAIIEDDAMVQASGAAFENTTDYDQTEETATDKAEPELTVNKASENTKLPLQTTGTASENEAVSEFATGTEPEDMESSEFAMGTAPEAITAPQDGPYTDMTGINPENASFVHTASLIIAIVVLAGIVLSLIYLAWKSLKK